MLLQKNTVGKGIALSVGVSRSTLSRELERNRIGNGKHPWNKTRGMAMARRERTTGNSRKDSPVVREVLEHVRRDDRSPRQVTGYMKREGRLMSHGLTCRYVRADESGELAGHCRNGMKHDRPNCTAKTGNFPGCTNIHGRPEEVDGGRFSDRKMDTIAGRNGKGAIPTLTERLTDFIFTEKLEYGKEAAHAVKTAIRLLSPYRGDGVKTMTTDNGNKSSVHGKITEAMKGTTVYFADPCSSWQKGTIEDTDKLIRQYVPKGTDFSNPDNSFLKKVQAKINARPRENLNFSTPKCEFLKHFL